MRLASSPASRLGWFEGGGSRGGRGGASHPPCAVRRGGAGRAKEALLSTKAPRAPEAARLGGRAEPSETREASAPPENGGGAGGARGASPREESADGAVPFPGDEDVDAFIALLLGVGDPAIVEANGARGGKDGEGAARARETEAAKSEEASRGEEALFFSAGGAEDPDAFVRASNAGDPGALPSAL